MRKNKRQRRQARQKRERERLDPRHRGVDWGSKPSTSGLAVRIGPHGAVLEGDMRQVPISVRVQVLNDLYWDGPDGVYWAIAEEWGLDVEDILEHTPDTEVGE